MPIADVNGWQFAYEDHGEGEAVVLLHGVLMERSMWAHQIEALRPRFRVVAVDAPGHGESPRRPVGDTLEDEADALVAFARELGLGAPVWIGHSMGAMKAMRIALRHPDAVRALVLVDTQPFPENPDMKASYDAMIDVVKEHGSNPDLAAVVGSIMLGPEFLPTPEGQRWVKHFESLDGHDIESEARAVFDRGDISDRVGEITAPALAIHGTDDVPIPIDAAHRYVPLIPGARLVEVPGAGHTAPCEKPEQVTQAIVEFLDAL